MLRLILLGLLIYLLYRVLTRPLELFFKFRRLSKDRFSKKTPPKLEAEELMPCALCGTFISQHEGEYKNSQFVCKPACHSPLKFG